MYRKIVPDVVTEKSICSLKKEATAREAAENMAAANCAAVIVVDDQSKIIGILTERDLSRKVVANGSDSNTVLVSEIMTVNPDTLSPDDSAGDALELMSSRGYRHLPVAVDGKCVAVVSIRDLYSTVKEALEEDIKETEAFVFGDRYGA
ncbi:MAG: CBS domain-containing protein [Rhodospirillales bacterium]|jgi:CBS domain-containing protein|nr:CBS domain-containing protein [Rhodospirillales bacterium]